MARDDRFASATVAVLLVLLMAILGPLPAAARPASATVAHPTGTVPSVADPARPALTASPEHASDVRPASAPSPLASAITITSFTNASSAGLAPFTVTFSLTVTTSGASAPVTYMINWMWGDGSSVFPSTLTNSTTSPNASQSESHTYTALGEYSATVGVQNSLNSTPALSHKNVVYVETPLMVAWSTTDNPVDYPGWFNASAQVSGGASPYTYVWLSTPIGCLANQGVLNCTPPAAGSNFVHLQVTDVHGLRTNSWQNFTVKSALAVRLTYLSWFFCNGTVGTFQANLSAYSTGGTLPDATTWDFGDGTPNATNATIAHRFAIGPVYLVTATVLDAGGGRFHGTLNVSAAYPACTTSTSVSYIPPLILLQGGVFLLAIALVVLVLLLVRRRPAAPPTPVASWRDGGSVAPGATGGGSPKTGGPEMPPGKEP